MGRPARRREMLPQWSRERVVVGDGRGRNLNARVIGRAVELDQEPGPLRQQTVVAQRDRIGDKPEIHYSQLRLDAVRRARRQETSDILIGVGVMRRTTAD